MAIDTARSGSRVRAPELHGRGGWLNTGGQPLSLAELRGKIVLLDFWTFCCINCLHVLDELREVEEKYADVLVIIGVHSPKFVHEADHEALAAAVERYDVAHPVLDDPDLVTWNQYAVRAWPTLAVVDPEGYVVAQMAGEGHAHGLDRLLDGLVAEHEAKGTLRRGDSPYVPPPPPQTELRFPGKVVELADGSLLVSDSKNHSLAVLDHAGERVQRRIGTGTRGHADGVADAAQLNEPQGLAVLPPDVAERVGYDVVVADTVNHLLRGVDSATGTVRTVAGTGRQWWQGSPFAGEALDVDLSSPWDVAWYAGEVAVAMAGIHQLWAFDPVAGTARAIAGTTGEGLKDGPAADAAMAQPSGLAADPDGETLWIADAEVSALRYLRGGELRTVVGKGLFDFGHRDGPAAEALLQHPLDVAVLPDGSIAVCDTYNGALRRYDPATDEVSTLAVGLAEPSGAAVVDGELVVVESAAHRLSRPVAPGALQRIAGAAHRTQRPATDVAPGSLDLEVVFAPPPGQKLDERDGPATRLTVTSSPPALLAEGSGIEAGLTRRLLLAEGHDGGVLHVSVMAASCDEDVEHAACHVHQQDWGIPVRVVPEGPSRLELVLRGMGS
ncbi:MAG: NHL domain-containing thioredoxin family protein [Frankiaceae bacterium]